MAWKSMVHATIVHRAREHLWLGNLWLGNLWLGNLSDVEDAVAAQMWSCFAMTVLIKNMASSWKTFGLDNIPDSLIRVVKSDSIFE